jgi:hypothetical protein
MANGEEPFNLKETLHPSSDLKNKFSPL